MKTKAFTLLEVMIILVILVALASLAVPAIRGALNSAQRAKVLSNVKQIHSVLLIASGENDNLWPKEQSFSDWIAKLPPRISTNDVKSLFSGGGINVSQFPPEKSAILVYQVGDYSPEDYILSSSHNWNAATPSSLEDDKEPFGESGFVAITKGGRGIAGFNKDSTNTAIAGQPRALDGNPLP